jgi:hypothetical protein
MRTGSLYRRSRVGPFADWRSAEPPRACQSATAVDEANTPCRRTTRDRKSDAAQPALRSNHVAFLGTQERAASLSLDAGASKRGNLYDGYRASVGSRIAPTVEDAVGLDADRAIRPCISRVSARGDRAVGGREFQLRRVTGARVAQARHPRCTRHAGANGAGFGVAQHRPPRSAVQRWWHPYYRSGPESAPSALTVDGVSRADET